MYDPSIGRWNGVDLLAENYQNYTPYNYVLGNPINWVDPNGRFVSDTLSVGRDGVADAGTLDPVEITAQGPSRARQAIVNTFWAFDRAVGIDNYPNGSGTATVDYQDVGNFNNEASQLPYGIGAAYSLTLGALLDIPVGMGEIFDEGDLGSGGLKIAALIPAGKGLYLLRVGSKWKVLNYSRNIWRVGPYNKLRGLEAGLQAHHVGQKAIMSRIIPGYDWRKAPSILVPTIGHTKGNVVSRSTKGLSNARQVIARDILELRRVYPDIPNSSLQELIQLNKKMYPSYFKK